ncbi:helix-turn-helix domain-containing protein [Eisenbergiella sp.]
MDILAKRIKKMRESNKMTQVQLGSELNVAQETISGYEIGRIVPPADMLVKLADSLNTSVDFLLGRTDCLTPPYHNTITDSESNLLYHFRRLSTQKQQRVIGYIEAIKDNDIR